MKRIVILLEEKWHTESLPDAAAAVRAYQEYGFDTDLWILEEQDRITGEQSAIPNEPTSDTVTGPNGPHSSILSGSLTPQIPERRLQPYFFGQI